ncbi:MAG: phosphoribosylglycinamide formyltransferase [Candidatus Melainabacteria bacterium GWA2_34_9]|nr:MAG: phosphoribosylglycinamide formyltransferase [Candidatus Melainabacteria bacterium GWA2_34_9]
MDGFKTNELLNAPASQKNIAVLVSGNGSNLKALINAVNTGKITNANIALVISNKKNVNALKIAKDAEIPAVYIARDVFDSDEEYDLFLLNKLNKYSIDLVLLAGYLRIITPTFLKAYENRILNIHPSLLPSFGGKGMYGMKVHQAVLNSKSDKSGCTVHLVTEEIDGGPILAQACVSIAPEDTAEVIAAKILIEEHKLYPQAVNNFISTIMLNSI